MKIASLGDLLKEHGHADAMESKTVYRTTDSADWYQHNGYYRLAESYYGDRVSLNGARVNSFSALCNTVFFGCVKIISEDTGSVPLFLMRTKGEQKTAAVDLPLYTVLHDAPNEEVCAVDLRSSMTAHALVTGNGYSRIVRRSSDGQVIALWLLQPEQVRQDRTSNGKLYYIHKEGNSAERNYAARDILDLRGFGWNATEGYDVVKQFREAIGLGMSAEQYAARFFDNDATPGVVLRTAERLSPEAVANMKAAYIANHKAHGVAVAHSGLEIQNPAFNPQQSQFIEQRVFQLLEICRIFRMPPHKLAELSRATFSNIEQQQREYYTNTLRPWLVRWEQAIKRCCIDEADLYAEHAIEGLLRGDFTTQTQGFSKLLAAGVYSINEVRSLLNLNPVDGGDAHFVQINMGEISAVAEASLTDPNATQTTPDTATGTNGKPQLVRVKGLFA
jgi:HK97 family phage portal protein